ncbi:copper resistance CopC family protein [Rathayibacter toxicus]|uniref:CopC domain-containing protein n=1 Tax=Rathayibacter toxicus TaxID=145458 RepID=A0A2S5Y8D0_9MICO|nr:copper resistance CopC family protein [Rathayibacter toxicus]ALS57091.1 hypothetical protein APU90_04335 [Rathayibacter toxicus]PPG23033.1 hypothetical protein C5D15_01925 [Rathayibacter toxicus]PPG47615.1 hypothetical protein C5D16_01920 [Rathayibacter toxicus]PPH24755.1 hypothetical protein C5D17_01890 [Rathayibacter toxicus]PPH58683.1 hypothetical protein C5D30_01915 [Rathayibacter toxicus]
MTSYRLFCAAVAAGLLSSLAVATPAHAHNYLVSTSPAADTTITQQPGKMVLATNDDLLTLGNDGSAAALRVVGPDGRYYGDGCVSVVGPAATMPLALGSAGAYTVIWQVVSTDGHPVSGQYAFTWAPSDGVPLAEGSSSVPDCNGTVAVTQNSPGANVEVSSAVDPALLSDVLWIGGGLVVAVVVAVGVTLLVARRRSQK